jgi:hypothetical protein
LDNLIVVWEGMEWAQSLGLDVLFIKIDFEKAYHCMEWPFILKMLKAWSFRSFCMRVVESLFTKASPIYPFIKASHKR